MTELSDSLHNYFCQTEAGKKPAKKNPVGKKVGRKSFSGPKTQNSDFCACPSENVIKCNASGKKGKCRVANAFLTRLKLIWPKSSLKTIKMSKNTFLAKGCASQWVNNVFTYKCLITLLQEGESCLVSRDYLYNVILTFILLQSHVRDIINLV